MGCRLRSETDRIFDCFVELVAPADNQNAWVLQKYPDTFHEEEILKEVPKFAYPSETSCNTVQHFSFVLTSLDSKLTFGFVRQPSNAQTSLCLLSAWPWHDLFYKVLNHIAELTHHKESSDLPKFLEALYKLDVPDLGSELRVYYNGGKSEFVGKCQDHTKLCSIPENRNLTEYYNAIDSQHMMAVFASMLFERRVLIVSNKLSRLSACVQAANSLIYPMHWQHIYIPLLPKHLVDYLSAPMPFLIGVPTPSFINYNKNELGEAVILFADENRIETPFNDLLSLPNEVVISLRRKLKASPALLGEGVARAFLRAVVQLIGDYREGLRFVPGQKITFDRTAFLKARSPNLASFTENILSLQIFHQFIEERLDMLNSGCGFSDEFEKDLSLYADKNNTKLKTQYKDWLTHMRKEGGAILKQVRKKTNLPVRSAYKSVKDGGRRAYKQVRSRFQDMNLDSNPPNGHYADGSVRSAPSSPTMLRSRRSTGYDYQGSKHASARGGSTKIGLKKRQHTSALIITTPKSSLSFYRPLENHSAGNERKKSGSESGNLSQSSPEFEFPRSQMDLMEDMKDVIFPKADDVIIKTETTNDRLLVSPSNDDEKKLASDNLILLDASADDSGRKSNADPVAIFDPLISSSASSTITQHQLPLPERTSYQPISDSRSPFANGGLNVRIPVMPYRNAASNPVYFGARSFIQPSPPTAVQITNALHIPTKANLIRPPTLPQNTVSNGVKSQQPSSWLYTQTQFQVRSSIPGGKQEEELFADLDPLKDLKAARAKSPVRGVGEDSNPLGNGQSGWLTFD